MPTTQVVCPHCGSTLNFGMGLADGVPVECLICMRSFTAPNTESAPLAEVPPVPKVPKAPPTEVPIAAPHAAPTPITAGEPPLPLPRLEAPGSMLPERKARSVEHSSSSSSRLLMAIIAVLLLVMTGGISLAIWKITTATRASATYHEEQIAQSSGSPSLPAKPEKQKKAKDEKKITPAPDGLAQKPDAGGEPGDDSNDEMRRRLEAEKKKLVRTNIPKADPDEAVPQKPKKPDGPRLVAPGLEQKRVDEAIQKGIVYLKQTQTPTGTWPVGHDVGIASLGGLTMLESGVPANDLFVQRSAALVRSKAAMEKETYELSLAILFLDRLGDVRDRPLIQGMALRLLAGQNQCGGWSYRCPILTPPEMYQLMTFLHANKQPSLLKAMDSKTTASGIATNPGRDPKGTIDPFQQLNQLLLQKGVGDIPGKSDPSPSPKDDTPPEKPKVPPQVAKIPPKVIPMPLPLSIRGLQIVQNQGKAKGKLNIIDGPGDNSNTQFALLALWAARRHDVPTDQALLMAYQRFQTSQSSAGSWGYRLKGGAGDAMTCVGLLGQAMGHGVSPDIIGVDPKDPKKFIIRPALEDPTIKKGLSYIAANLGQPAPHMSAASVLPSHNLYFLWSVERVAMLYDLRTIGGKDWYGWGAQILVYSQHTDGQWAHSQYPGANSTANTCFALLFLRRSNLVQDLTNQMRLLNPIRDDDR